MGAEVKRKDWIEVLLQIAYNDLQKLTLNVPENESAVERMSGTALQANGATSAVDGVPVQLAECIQSTFVEPILGSGALQLVDPTILPEVFPANSSLPAVVDHG